MSRASDFIDSLFDLNFAATRDFDINPIRSVVLSPTLYDSITTEAFNLLKHKIGRLSVLSDNTTVVEIADGVVITLTKG